jgi:hypothetical protein
MIIGTVALLLDGCSPTTAIAPTSVSGITNAGAAVSKVMSTVSGSSPQVKPSSVITSHWQPFKTLFRNPTKRFVNALLPSAFASTSSLEAIWGIAGVVPSVSTLLALNNEFYGGNGTGVTSLTQYTFTITSGNATAGATYTNNGHTYTVSNTVAASTAVAATAANGSNPLASGALTKTSGTGDATLAFSTSKNSMGFSCDITAGFCPTPGAFINNNESLVDFVGQELAPNFHNTNDASVTIFGRLNSALGVGCTIGQLITTLDTDGLPPVGTYSITFPADTSNIIYQTAQNGGCGMQTAMAGQGPISITFTAVNGSANYNKLMSLNVGNQLSIYLKLDLVNGKFNFMQIESQLGSSRYAGDRTIVSMTGMNSPGSNKIVFEYMSTGSNCTAGNASGNSLANCGTTNGDGTGPSVNSAYSGGQWNTSFEFHRGFIDQANDVAYLFSSNGSPGRTNGTVDTTHPSYRSVFTVAGRPNEIAACGSSGCLQELAFSAGFVGQTDGAGGTSIGEANNTVNTTDYNGCLNVGNISVTDDSTLAICGVVGTNASAAAVTMDAIRAHYSADVITTLVNGTSANYVLPFTDGTNIYTATY